MKYAASADRSVKLITVFCLVIIGAVLISSVKSLSKAIIGSLPFFMHLLIIFVLLATPLLCYVLSVKHYRFDNNILHISRMINSFAISTKDMKEIRLLTEADSRGMIRTFGVGGLFGYFGRFYTRSLGTVYLYTSQQKNRILITTKKGLKIIISPDDVQLMNALQHSLSLTNE